MTRLFITLTVLLFGCGMTSTKQNTMTLDELLAKERNLYLETFHLGLDQNKTDKSAVEVMLQVTADQNKSLPEVYQLNRYDLINVNADGKYSLTEFNMDKDSIMKFQEQTYEVDGITVKVNPFVWNGCEFLLDQKPDITFENWARKWIDIDDKKTVGADSLQHVIHGVTYPEEVSDGWTTSIDFGSAPIDAFKDLLKVLSLQGIKKVEVHSKTFTN